MAILLKNKTGTDIEINDIGITIPANGVYDLGDDKQPSEELDALIASASIVFMDDTDPNNIVEVSHAESILIAKATSGVDLTVYYRKDEIDTLLNSKASTNDVYDTSQTYTRTEVDNIIDGIINGAPDLLDTIQEISAALGNDPNFATSITTQLSQKADINHNHDGRYYQRGEVDGLLSNKANLNHNHDGTYANVNHNHDGQYAQVSHNHDGRYSQLSHNHDSQYSPISHNHNGVYAPVSHNHNNDYYTKSEIDAKFNAIKFGKDYHFAQATSVTTMYSTSWVTKVTLTVNVSESGNYRIGLGYMWNYNSTSRDFRAQVLRNSSEVIYEHRQEPKDSSGTFGSTGTDQRHAIERSKTMRLDPGQHTFKLHFASSQNNYAASMWDAQLEFWRVD